MKNYILSEIKWVHFQKWKSTCSGIKKVHFSEIKNIHSFSKWKNIYFSEMKKIPFSQMKKVHFPEMKWIHFPEIKKGYFTGIKKEYFPEMQKVQLLIKKSTCFRNENKVTLSISVKKNKNGQISRNYLI